MKPNQQVRVGDIVIANNQPLKLIAGPCQLESRSHALEMSTALYEISKNLGIEIIYKTSFDKAFFEGILPCADCDGIKRNILLNADHTFLMESIYLGKAGHPFKEKGTYKVSENFLILSIEAPNKYSIGEGYIEQMDVNGNRIISTLNYKLHRK